MTASKRDLEFDDAMAAARALQRVFPLAPYGAVRLLIGQGIPPVLPYRAWCERTHLPPGKKRQRTDRWTGEGATLAEALHALADSLEAERKN